MCKRFIPESARGKEISLPDGYADAVFEFKADDDGIVYGVLIDCDFRPISQKLYTCDDVEDLYLKLTGNILYDALSD